MKGFVYKDLRLLGNLWKTYAMILGIFLLLTVTGVYEPTFFLTMTAMLLCMYPATSFSYDELAKWDRFAITVPDGRKKVVQGKYMFALILLLGALAVNLLLSLALPLLGKGLPDTNLIIAVAGTAAAFLLNAVLLPLLFRFGSQKGRIFLVVGIAFIAGILGALSVIGTSVSFGSGDLIPCLIVLLALALGLLFVSYRVSLNIYKKKDF